MWVARRDRSKKASASSCSVCCSVSGSVSWSPWRAAVIASLLASALGCKGDRAASKPATSTAEVRQMVGVDPKEFRCDSLVSEGQLGQLVGGRARAVESAVTTPLGIAAPCTYLVEGSAAAGSGGGSASPVGWTFDLDCREGMQARAEALFDEYTRTSADAVERAAAVPASERGERGERGEAGAQPALAREVEVGARGLDHHGQGLLFVDDDAPCYVRVVGPGASERLALAQHLVRTLAPITAPMTRRPAPLPTEGVPTPGAPR